MATIQVSRPAVTIEEGKRLMTWDPATGLLPTWSGHLLDRSVTERTLNVVFSPFLVLTFHAEWHTVALGNGSDGGNRPHSVAVTDVHGTNTNQGEIMRRITLILIAGGLMLPGALAASPVSATNIGNEGCTPGYWKNHTDNWFEDVGVPIPITKTLAGAGYEPESVPGTDTLLAALQYHGGRGAAGAERILLRAAAAAWLNAAHEGLGYPYRRNNDPLNIVQSVNDAIATGDRATMLALATVLDDANNLGCPLN